MPLSPTAIKSLSVIGPNTNVTKTMIGNYEGTPCKYSTPLQGLNASVATVYQARCANIVCGIAQVDEAKRVAALVYLNLLITEVASVSKGPIILVIMSGGGMDIQFAKKNPKVTIIL